MQIEPGETRTLGDLHVHENKCGDDHIIVTVKQRGRTGQKRNTI